MGLAKQTIPELDAILNDLDRQRLALRERARQVMAARNKLIRETQLDYWGLNEKEYEAAKARSRASKVPAHRCLNEARQVANKNARDTQTAIAEGIALGVKAAGV